MHAEGWYEDPFGVHEARWFSDGLPTALVRDGRSESQDAPPRATYDGDVTPVDVEHADGGDDLLRADSDEGPFDARTGSRAAWDTFDQLPKP
jgi:hypothetical protein